MPDDPRPRTGLVALTGSDDARLIDDAMRDAFDILDSIAALADEGLASARPTSTPADPGTFGRFYFATDTPALWFDYGQGWVQVSFPRAGQIATALLADDAVTAAKIAANAVGSSELADNAVDTAAIADDAVTAAKIAADAVGSSEIAANAVGSSEIAADAVGSSEIAADAVGASELADNAVDTAAIAAKAVTAAKIADNTITASQIAALLAGTAAPAVVTSLPSTPTDGQEVYYYASGTQTLWHLKYMAYLGGAWGTAGGGYGNWVFLGGVPLLDTTASDASITAGSWTTPTGNLSVALPLKGLYEITVQADAKFFGGADQTITASYKMGATEASDDDAASARSQASAASTHSVSRTTFKYVSAATTVTERVKSSGAIGVVGNRRLVARPVVVG